MVKKSYFFNKIQFSVFILFLFTLPTFGQGLFSGYTGTAGSLRNGAEDKKVVANLDAFFAGQLNFGNIFQFRTVASLKTLNLTKQFLFTDIESLVSIDEISLAATFRSGDMTHHIALFGGEYESIGSDVFLQRHFGIAPIASRITETWKGFNSTTLYPYSDFGLSYTIRMVSPNAISSYLYYDYDYDENISQLNFDLRYAGLFKYATIDFSGGIVVPFEREDSNGDKVLILVRHIDLHMGTTLHLKFDTHSSLFIQGGINKLRINPESDQKVVALSDIYFLFEPRFTSEMVNIAFSFYNTSKQVTDNSFFLDYPLGFNLSTYKDNIVIGQTILALGSNLTLSAIDMDFGTIMTMKPSDISLIFSPFFELSLSRGKLKGAAKIDFLHLFSDHKNLGLFLGYTVQL